MSAGLAERILASEALTPDQLREGLSAAVLAGEHLLVQLFVRFPGALPALTQVLSEGGRALDSWETDGEALAALPLDFTRRLLCLPIRSGGSESGRIRFGVVDPWDEHVTEEAAYHLRRPVEATRILWRDYARVSGQLPFSAASTRAAPLRWQPGDATPAFGTPVAEALRGVLEPVRVPSGPPVTGDTLRPANADSQPPIPLVPKDRSRGREFRVRSPLEAVHGAPDANGLVDALADGLRHSSTWGVVFLLRPGAYEARAATGVLADLDPIRLSLPRPLAPLEGWKGTRVMPHSSIPVLARCVPGEWDVAWYEVAVAGRRVLLLAAADPPGAAPSPFLKQMVAAAVTVLQRLLGP